VTASTGVQGITEGDIANYLANTPGFFERHAELLASVQLTSPHGQRAVSLQERQMEMLRERIKGLERKIVEMIRHRQENLAIADRLHRFTAPAAHANAAELPRVAGGRTEHEFLIPQAAIRLWGADTPWPTSPGRSPSATTCSSFAASLAVPYCGVNAGFEAGGLAGRPDTVMSVALIPLRNGAEAAFGLLVLGSPDPTRYSADMGTEFLMRIGEVASAALSG
jgi:uncharacterized protein YigA (DUF484 family)